MRRPRMTDKQAGELILGMLSEAYPEGLSGDYVVQQLNISYAKFGNGKQWLKDHLAGPEGEPFVYDPSTKEYFLASFMFQANNYSVREVRKHWVQLRRVRTGTVEPAVEKFNDATRLRYVRHLLNQIEGNLEEIVAILGEPGA